jgi:hypothetical protein
MKKPFYLVFITLFLSIISSSFVLNSSRVNAINSQIWGNISAGKFYRFSVPPMLQFRDKWNGNGEFTDGVKLTDEQLGFQWPILDVDNANWVAWYNSPVSITIDLGKLYAVSNIKIHSYSRPAWDILYPSSVNIETSLDSMNWYPYGTTIFFPSNAFGENYDMSMVEGNGGWVNARYIRYNIGNSGKHIFIDEVWVEGSINNILKRVPENKCYHGAFPIQYPEKNNYNTYYLDISGFENLAERPLKMVLWYANWVDLFQDSVGFIIDDINHWYNLNGRYLQIGFLPEHSNSINIAQGNYDTFLKQWFTDCKNKNYPTWIRPMNEMNGNWTFDIGDNLLRYGGDPKTYIQAWRRMYNIAEQIGATGENQIFVWSPDAHEYLPQPENDMENNDPSNPNYPYFMENYYPGHQYVDWVGVSAYGHPKLTDPNHLETLDSLILKIHSLYYQNKPLMISEGGAEEIKYLDPNDPSKYIYTDEKEKWIDEWFTITRRYDIKACVWFNGVDSGTLIDTRIDTSNGSLKAYRPYFLE